jgi:ribosomal protein L11 methyltransferase
LPVSAEESLAGALSHHAILGVEFRQLDAGLTRVEVWVVNHDHRLAESLKGVLLSLGANEVDLELRSDENWAATWKDHLNAFVVGRRWWVDPDSDSAAAAPEGRHRLAVVPQAAFGSGTHESTQLVLMELEEIDCRHRAVLDLGTGSGILAVASDRLGAARAVGLDIDPIAAWEAMATADRQDWICRPLIILGSLDCLGAVVFDVVLCNMITSQFKPLLGEVARLLSRNGVAVFSGILSSERAEVEAALVENGLNPVAGRTLGDWVSICGRPKEAVS